MITLGTFQADGKCAPYRRLTFLLPGLPLSVWPWEARLRPYRSSCLACLGVIWTYPTAVLPSLLQTFLSPHTHSEIKLLHSPIRFSHQQDLERIFFLSPRSRFYLLCWADGGRFPLPKQQSWLCCHFYKWCWPCHEVFSSRLLYSLTTVECQPFQT